MPTDKTKVEGTLTAEPKVDCIGPKMCPNTAPPLAGHLWGHILVRTQILPREGRRRQRRPSEAGCGSVSYTQRDTRLNRPRMLRCDPGCKRRAAHLNFVFRNRTICDCSPSGAESGAERPWNQRCGAVREISAPPAAPEGLGSTICSGTKNHVSKNQVQCSCAASEAQLSNRDRFWGWCRAAFVKMKRTHTRPQKAGGGTPGLLRHCFGSPSCNNTTHEPAQKRPENSSKHPGSTIQRRGVPCDLGAVSVVGDMGEIQKKTPELVRGGPAIRGESL